MSAGDDRSDGVSPEDLSNFLRTWYHVFVLAILMGFMLGVRLIPIDRFLLADEIRLQAVDSFYHWRATEWTVEHFPFTQPYDPFTGYPTGRFVGQFGTLFDQLIALLAFFIGAGSPSQGDILVAALLGVPLMAMLVAIPVYKIGERLGGRIPALAGVAILALSPGVFFQRTVTGMFQHHVAEVLFMALAVWWLMVALRVAEQELPIWELVVDRAWTDLKRPTLYAALPGVALLLYIWAWPPALMMIGILNVIFVVAILIEHVRGRSPEPIAYVGVVCLGVVTILGLILAEQRTLSTSTTTFSYFQSLLALMGLLACIGLAWLSRFWHRQQYSALSYPAGVASAGIIGIVLLWLLLPDVFSTVMSNVTGRIIPIDPGVGAVTVAEASPPPDPAHFMYDQFGFAFFTMIVGLVLLAGRSFYGRPYRAEHTLVIVWTLFLISMSFTQIRFNYYLILPVAVINAYVLSLALEWMNLPSIDQIRDIEGYQVLTIAVVFMVLFMPLLPPLGSPTVTDVANAAQPSFDGIVWSESNEFLYENTPRPGDWGPNQNAEQLEYLGWYDHPGNGFDYPDGSWGVMTWWDYGHLVTTQAERIPHSNPFQQNARSSAGFLLAESEERAELVLDAIEAGGDGVRNVPDEELHAIVDDHEGELKGDMRFVMVEDQMVAGKFGAKVEWAGEDHARYATQGTFEFMGENHTLPTQGGAYDETIMTRMYFEDGDGLQHYRLVHETANEWSLVGNILIGEDRHRMLRLNTQLGIGVTSWEQAAQFHVMLEQANFASQVIEPFGTGTGILAYDTEIQPAIKTFERVPGATIQGEADEDATEVMIHLQLVATTTERPIVYTQSVDVDEHGQFELTVPYATTDMLSVEDGYTESAVEPHGNFSIAVLDGDGDAIQQGQVDVPEQAIYDGESVTVELEAVGDDENDA